MSPGSIVIARNGHAATVIVLAHDTCEEEAEAARLLQLYVLRSTGAELPVVGADTESPTITGLSRLYVGRHARFDRVGPALELATLDPDGFLVWPDGDSLTVVGPTGRGTEHAVLELLERYVGVRWLMPGPEGEHVPEHDHLTFPLEAIRQEPCSRSRMIFSVMSPSALAGPAGYEWGRRNRLHGDLEFTHALWRVVPPERHAARHRDWFPARLPAAPYGWQPLFSSNETVAAAADELVAHFDRHPKAASVSLAVNDYSGFCEQDVALARGINSAGFRDLSDVYFGWVNAVVERVLHEHPGKRFGVLAYHDVLDPPTFDLHPAVVPFITGDRVTWSDPLLGASGRRLTEAWSERATELGWWEYLHGGNYLVPKVFFDQLRRNMVFAADHRVVHHFAESWPDWAGGPQLWLAARLQWNPDQDIGELLGEWCRAAVGAAPALELADYYRRWERWWHDRIPDSDWLNRWRTSARRTDYLRFDDPSYLKLVSAEDWALSRRDLASVVELASAGKPAARADLLARKLDFYRHAARQYDEVATLEPPPMPGSEEEAMLLVQEIVTQLDTSLRPAVIHRSLILPDAIGRSAHLPTPLERTGLPVGAGPGRVATLLSWLRKRGQDADAVLRRIRGLAASQEPALADLMQLLLVASADGATRIAIAPDAWVIEAAPAGALLIEGDKLAAHGIAYARLRQTVRLDPGRYAVLVEYLSPGRSGTGHLRLGVEMTGEHAVRSPSWPIWRSAGRLSSAEWYFSVGDGQGARDVELSLVLTSPIEGPSFPCMDPDETLVVERVGCYRLSPNP